MSERSTRYETAVATFIGLLALVVSAYTAYVQRQQVRAQVLPILQFSTSDMPTMTIAIDNKGVGPALIRHAIVTVDGQPMRDWNSVLERVLGSGRHPFEESDIGSLVLSAGESVHILTPHDDKGAPLTIGPPGSPSAIFDAARSRIGVEICYCSTLGDCWTLRDAPGTQETNDETKRCPSRSERTFRQ